MALTIEQISDEDAEIAFAPASDIDPELLVMIKAMNLGQAFRVVPDEGESDRKVKRRVNATAREAGYELDWRPHNAGGLVARLRATMPDDAGNVSELPRRGPGRPRKNR